LDQGIISTFKANYLRRIFAQAVQATTGEGAILLTEFWKDFKIRQAVENIYDTWKEVTPNTVRAVCENIVCLTAQMNFVASKIELTLLLKKLASLERILGLKMLIRPVSENAWIRIHSHSLTRTLQNWSNSAPTTRKKKLRLKERGVSQRKF
jgi:hypothetical protein